MGRWVDAWGGYRCRCVQMCADVCMYCRWIEVARCKKGYWMLLVVLLGRCV